jgi:putative chitinase
MTQINRGFFFTHVRRMMFSNVLQQSQVDGMSAILDGWEAKYATDDDRWLAYALATTYHETDQHMQPINEYGKGRGRPYGKADPTTGQVYYGRGFVQLTWERNYETMSNLLVIPIWRSSSITRRTLCSLACPRVCSRASRSATTSTKQKRIGSLLAR